MSEIEIIPYFEKFGAESIVGNCNANRGEVLEYHSCTERQISYAEKNGITIVNKIQEPLNPKKFIIDAVKK